MISKFDRFVAVVTTESDKLLKTDNDLLTRSIDEGCKKATGEIILYRLSINKESFADLFFPFHIDEVKTETDDGHLKC
jgi:hypothetical protein